MHDDVGTVIERPAQVGRRHRIVDDQRHTVTMRNGRDALDVGDIALRIAERFDEHGLGFGVDQRLEGTRIAVIGKARFDAVLRQRVRKQVVGAPVKRARGDDVVAGFRDRQIE
jgi:hypothetical protein